eukprot:COSAG02_NODE_7178_length_3136_cov_2.115904_3_plen_39_part_00
MPCGSVPRTLPPALAWLADADLLARTPQEYHGSARAAE